MSQADEIRKHILEKYIEPARKRGLTQIIIKAGDIDNEMKLGSAPNVNNVLGGKELQRMCAIKLIKKSGSVASATGKYTYLLAPNDNSTTKTGLSTPVDDQNMEKA